MLRGAFPDARGRYGPFGGRYVPETLVPALDRLEAGVKRFLADPEFRAAFDAELRGWAGRPTPLTPARALSRRWGAELHVDARLSELSFGEWEGRRFDDLEREDGPRFARWMCAFEVEAPPRGETVADLRMRLAAWVEERRRAEAVVLAITHAGVIRMARSLALGIAFADVVTQEVEHLAPERVPPSQFRVLNA